MTITTNGKTLIWLVFHADGYECSDFLGAFETEEEAQKVAKMIRVAIGRYHTEVLKREMVATVDVTSVVLGEYRVPPDAELGGIQ